MKHPQKPVIQKITFFPAISCVEQTMYIYKRTQLSAVISVLVLSEFTLSNYEINTITQSDIYLFKRKKL